MPLSNFAKDRYVAPGMSTFTKADIPDMSAHKDQQTFWTLNFILSSMLRVKVPDQRRRLILTFLRRTEAAFDEYALARSATLDYLDEPSRVSAYLRALRHWEVFLSQAWQACSLFMKLSSQEIFRKGDGSPYERLNMAHNTSKHSDSRSEAGLIPAESTMPLWLTNEGIACKRVCLAYCELRDILAELALLADRLSNPQPIDPGTDSPTDGPRA